MKKPRRFETKVQENTYRVLKEVAISHWAGTLREDLLDIPYRITPGKVATVRCCVWKERAILGERAKVAMGGDRENRNAIEVIDIACDECPSSGFMVSDSCRGCLSHRCQDVCPVDAFTYDDKFVAHINKSKCINCGQCAKVCPYHAILDHKRPCQIACKAKAININEEDAAAIDYSKCTSCGACSYLCPWGAIVDKSYILDVIDIIKGSEGGKNYPVFAVIAPAISSQARDGSVEQNVTALRQLGFTAVVEAAFGADMVSKAEAQELVEKGFLTSSCCPAFVRLIKSEFPGLVPHISHNLSPMATIAKYIKENIAADARVVFVGPCTAKKDEIRLPEVAPYVDSVITFQEMEALLDSRDIDVAELPETSMDYASYFGRIFARSGGLSDAVVQALKELEVKDFELKAVQCNGLEECRLTLMKASKGILDANFIEGMACVGGCIGGAGCIRHDARDRNKVEKYSQAGDERTIMGALESLEHFKDNILTEQ